MLKFDNSDADNWNVPRNMIRAVVSLCLAASVVVLPAADAQAAYSDVPAGHWAKSAVEYVATAHDWMRDFGDSTFKPATIESRKLFARAAVKALDPTGNPDPAITFPDMPATDPFFPYANIAVKNGWLVRNGQDQFRPDGAMTVNTMYRSLVLGIGLKDAVAGLKAIHLADGTAVAHTGNFPYLAVGMDLGFRYNHADEAAEVLPGTALTRDEVAYALWQATTASSWELDDMIASYSDITLPNMSAAMQKMVEFGLRYVGYPYVYAGEWNTPSPSGYCCGYQPEGGFDCSGLVWWVMRAPGQGYDNTSVRPYNGWPLAERSSAAMASVGAHVSYDSKRTGDLIFYRSSSSSTISHVDIYVGRGWALDSSSDGVRLTWIADGYYRDNFM